MRAIDETKATARPTTLPTIAYDKSKAWYMVQTTLKRSGMDHTAFNLQSTPCQPFPRKHSPDGASTECGANI